MTTTAERLTLGGFEFEADDEDAYPTPLIGLRTMKEGLKRYRALCVACAVLGLVIGACFHLVIPPKYVAVTDLYLTEPTSSATYTTADDVSLAETSTVAYGALRLLHLPANLSDEPGTYVATAASDVLLQIKGDGLSRAKAVQWTSALAKSFLAVRQRALNGQTELVVKALQTEVGALSAQVNRLDESITALENGKATPSSSNEVANLVSERGTDESQLTTLQAQIQQDQLEQAAVDKGSYVLDPARALKVSAKRIFAEDGLSGLVAGLAIGVGGVVVASVISDKPRRRDELAQLIGAPVELSLSGPKEPWLLRWSFFRSWVKNPDTQLKAAQRRLRGQLGTLARPSLGVVAIGRGARDSSAVIVGVLAYSLAAEGKSVLLVDMAQGRPLARLFRQRLKGHPVREVRFGGQAFQLAIAPEDPVDLDHERLAQGVGCVLVLATGDPAIGANHLRPWAESAVVVLRAGKASATLVQAAGEMLRDAGVGVRSVLQLGAGKEDESFGKEGVSAGDGNFNQAAFARPSSGWSTFEPRS